MKVLVACEYSGRVRDAFIKKGCDAMSCDLLPTDLPGPHYQGDMFDLDLQSFDLVIAHPPCTYLTGAAEWAFADIPMINGVPRKIKDGTLIGQERRKARESALLFIQRIWSIGDEIRKSKSRVTVCVENPVGVITKRLPEMGKPQYVQQYWFGEDASKKTGLWLRGLPKLNPTNIIKPRIVNGLERWGNQTDSGQNKLPPTIDRWKLRSTTPNGLALAMAEQWG